VDAVETRAVHHDPAVDGHTLAVVTGAAAARGDGDAGGVARGEEGAEFVDGAGLGYDIGALGVEQRPEGGGIPVVILGEHLERVSGFDEIVGPEEGAELEAEGFGKSGHKRREVDGANTPTGQG
jgi:hypothetical protein